MTPGIQQPNDLKARQAMLTKLLSRNDSQKRAGGQLADAPVFGDTLGIQKSAIKSINDVVTPIRS